MWLGVDVGGPRKRFDVAVVDEVRLVHLERRLDVSEVVAVVDAYAPSVAAVDSPRTWAPPGASARSGELRLNREICGIRWTPAQATGETNPYYGWILEGLALYDALATRPVEVIEVFPTASWTRWFGPRADTRAAWTRRGLARLGLAAVPSLTSQDARDAIAAAVTARAYGSGAAECFGEIVVPAGGNAP